MLHAGMINHLKSLCKGRWPEILLLLLALLLRLVLLTIKPPHFDEGVNGWFVDQMMKLGYFKYDPGNYHGPLHFYVLFISLELFGRNLWAMRVPIALVSTLAVWVTLRFDRFFDKRLCQWAALAMAVSPAMVFYGRYAIHESWLLLFLLTTTWGFFALQKEGSRAGLRAVVLGITGMILTKETYIIHLACFGLAWLVWMAAQSLLPAGRAPVIKRPWNWTHLPWLIVASFLVVWGGMFIIVMTTAFSSQKGSFIADLVAGVWETFDVVLKKEAFLVYPVCLIFAILVWLAEHAVFPAESFSQKRQWNWQDLLAMLAIGLGLIIFFYTGNFLLPWVPSLANLYNTFADWVHTGQAGESGHEKPLYDLSWSVIHYTVGHGETAHQEQFALNYYWFYLLYRYEWPALLGAVIAVCTLRRGVDPRVRFLAIYGMGAIVAYSLVRYKTPWCIISLMWPLLFLFGWAMQGLAKITRPLGPPLVGGIIVLASLGDSIWLNFFHYTDENEPYVYVQTFKDINRVVDPLLVMAKYDSKNYHLNGTFIVSSYYPLPWMLGDFTNIGYYGLDAHPTPLDTDFLLIEKPRIKDVEAELKNAYFVERVKIRASQDSADFLLSYDKFKILFPGRVPELNPERADIE